MVTLACLCVVTPSVASAKVLLTFYAIERGQLVPHAFVTLRGRLDADGRRVKSVFGWATTAAFAAVLFGPTVGKVFENDLDVTGASERAESLIVVELDDRQYRKVIEIVDAWRHRPQPSYDLGQHNCIHFVGAIAAGAGLKVDFPNQLMRKPRKYLEHLIVLNPQLATAAPITADGKQTTSKQSAATR